MKIFVYNASCRNDNSYGLHIATSIISKIEIKANAKFDVIIRSPLNTKIEICKGCAYCFNNGRCVIRDDINIVKRELEESDLIIFVTPVFAHNVSGSMKNLIDRISHWIHLMHLRGKMGLSIVVSSTNGENYVLAYLKKIMEYLGIVTLRDIAIPVDVMSKEAIQSVIEFESECIWNKINLGEFSISPQQEMFFKLQKEIIKKQIPESYERIYWEKNGLAKSNTFEDVFRSAYHFGR